MLGEWQKRCGRGGRAPPCCRQLFMHRATASTANENPGCPGTELCPLNRIRAGTSVRIKQLCVDPEVGCRLREIGFGEDQIIQPLAGQTNIICRVFNARLAISARLAERILVEPLAA